MYLSRVLSTRPLTAPRVQGHNQLYISTMEMKIRINWIWNMLAKHAELNYNCFDFPLFPKLSSNDNTYDLIRAMKLFGV